MTAAMQSPHSLTTATTARSDARQQSVLPASTSRPVLLLLVAAAAIAGFLATNPQSQTAAIANAGPELTHLLRAMAALKTLFAAGAIAATTWRLGLPTTWTRLATYIVACAAMTAGPGLIWSMAYVKAGALLLHTGLIATILLLWRDPATTTRLTAAIESRRARK